MSQRAKIYDKSIRGTRSATVAAFVMRSFTAYFSERRSILEVPMPAAERMDGPPLPDMMIALCSERKFGPPFASTSCLLGCGGASRSPRRAKKPKYKICLITKTLACFHECVRVK